MQEKDELFLHGVLLFELSSLQELQRKILLVINVMKRGAMDFFGDGFLDRACLVR